MRSARGKACGIALLLVASACGDPPRDAVPSDSIPAEFPLADPDLSAEDTVAIVYTCPDGTSFAMRPLEADSIEVELPRRTLRMPRAVSASGARYESGPVVFWNRGAEASLEVGETLRTGCIGVPAATPWEKARLLGIEFRGIGQEPGWLLDIDEGNWLRYLGDYGTTRVFTTTATRSRESGEITYRAETEAGGLTVMIRPEPCTDAMSGHAFSHTVAVRLGDRDVAGCGRYLDGS